MEASVTGSLVYTDRSLRKASSSANSQCATSLRAGSFATAIAFLAMVWLLPVPVFAQVSPMWGTVPPQSNGNYTYFADPVSACAYQHAYYSAPTAFYGAIPYSGAVKPETQYMCQWQFQAGYFARGADSCQSDPDRPRVGARKEI